MLLEEAAYQQNIVLQASQAVNMCLALHEGMSTGSPEEVEAERLLRFSSTYMCTGSRRIRTNYPRNTSSSNCMLV